MITLHHPACIFATNVGWLNGQNDLFFYVPGSRYAHDYGLRSTMEGVDRVCGDEAEFMYDGE